MNPVALRFRVAGIPVKLNLQFKLAAAEWETTQNAITAQAGSAPYAVRLTIGQLDRLDDVTGLLVWRVAGFVVHWDIAYAVERQNGAHGFRGKTRRRGAKSGPVRSKLVGVLLIDEGRRAHHEGKRYRPMGAASKMGGRPHLIWFSLLSSRLMPRRSIRGRRTRPAIGPK